jgi:hypothetical protein
VNAVSVTADFPENIILEPGQTIDGAFQRVEKGRTKDGDARAIAVVEIDGQERSLWLHETALRSKFAQLRPEPGERVRVTKGAAKKRSESSGYSYWPFQVTAPEREPETVDWDDPLLAGKDDGGDQVDADALEVRADTAGLSEPERSTGEPDDGDIPF